MPEPVGTSFNALSIIYWKLSFGNHVFYVGTHVLYGDGEISLLQAASKHCRGYVCKEGEETNMVYKIHRLGWNELARLYRETQGYPETQYASRNIQEVVDHWGSFAHGPLMPLRPKMDRRYMEVAMYLSRVVILKER